VKALAQIPRSSVGAIAVTCAAVFVITAHTAGAGINTWTSHGPPGGDVRTLAIDPTTPSTLCAGTGRGVLMSTDGGNTWRAVNAGLSTNHVTALAIDPTTPGRLYAGTNGGGVFSTQQVPGCIGDCSGDGSVTIDELIAGVNIALGTLPIGVCLAFDTNDDGLVTVDELIAAVNAAFSGCGRDSCPTGGPTEFTDDFSSGNAASWSPASTGWTVVAGQYQGVGTDSSACAGLGLNQSLVRNLCARNVEVELDMTSVARVDKGVILRSTGPDNQIELNFRAARPDGFPADLIVQEVSDCRRTLLTPEFSVLIPQHDVGQRIHIRIRLVGNQLTVWIDGTQVLDGSFPFVNGSGQLGLGVIDGGLATFDNVSVRVLGR